MKSKARAAAIFAIPILALAAVAYWYFPRLPLTRPASMQLFVMGTNVATTTNTAPIMTVLRRGRRVTPHQCAYYGTLVATFQGGKTLHIGIIPGHERGRCEVYVRGIGYSVSRSRLMSAFQAASIPTNGTFQL